MNDKQNVTAGTQALLALEDAAPDALWATVSTSSTPLWLQVRMEFAMAMAETELNSIALPTRVTRTQVYSRLARAHLPSPQDATRFPSQRDVLFLVGGMTLYPDEGSTHNWLIDDFAAMLPGSAAVAQWRPLAGLPPATADTRSLDLAEGRIDLAARLRPAPEHVLGEVDRLVSKFAELLNVSIPDDRIAAIASVARYQESRRPHLEKEFARMLDRVQPRVVVMEDGSYGSRAPIISAMKQRGIQVVEPQHGWIGPSHGAYNYGAAGTSEEFRAGLPDVLMTFGEYWSRGLRYPAEVVPIGKPHMNAQAADLPAYESRPNELLVISSIAEPAETAEFTLRLRDALPSDWRVLFRPHPSERPVFTERYSVLVGSERIRLDENRDVFKSLRRARGVVGVASTVLYEALAMNCHVFVRDTTFASFIADTALGERLSGDDGIRRLVATLTSSKPQSGLDAAEVWMPDATKNFTAFLETVTGGSRQ